mmetsp:Transcript_11945/g.42726  ORF Transcript_11945/g.42726 Transcript_11945/m.42726 type:complete len:347 (+) Transcript_11945:111-1151(+)
MLREFLSWALDSESEPSDQAWASGSSRRPTDDFSSEDDYDPRNPALIRQISQEEIELENSELLNRQISRLAMASARRQRSQPAVVDHYASVLSDLRRKAGHGGMFPVRRHSSANIAETGGLAAAASAGEEFAQARKLRHNRNRSVPADMSKLVQEDDDDEEKAIEKVRKISTSTADMSTVDESDEEAEMGDTGSMPHINCLADLRPFQWAKVEFLNLTIANDDDDEFGPFCGQPGSCSASRVHFWAEVEELDASVPTESCEVDLLGAGALGRLLKPAAALLQASLGVMSGSFDDDAPGTLVEQPPSTPKPWETPTPKVAAVSTRGSGRLHCLSRDSEVLDEVARAL